MSRLASRSKIPPQLGEPFGVLPELSRALALCHVSLRYDTSRPAFAADGSHVNHSELCCYGKIARTCDSVYPAERARSEQSLSAGKDLVQRILKMRRGFRKILPHLIDVFFVAFLDLFAKQFLERAIAQPFITPLRKVRHQV